MTDMDDLDAKITAREIGPDKYNGKSVMKRLYCYDDNLPIYEKRESNVITQFEQMVLEHEPNILTKCLNPGVCFNEKFLFTHGEELFNELAVDIKKSRSGYGEMATVYSLPIIGKIKCGLNIINVKDEHCFTFKGRVYNADLIYSFKKGVSVLKEICPIYLNLPSNLPLNLVKIISRASSKDESFDLHHGYNSRFFSKRNSQLTYKHDNDLTKLLDDDITTCPCYVIRKPVEPIYVKLNQKGSFTITHIGILGCCVPVMPYYKKMEKTASAYKRNKRQKNKLLDYCINILDNTVPISYVKKFELWCKGSVTKKWIFIKHVTLNLCGVSACYSEELVSIDDNFNSLEGIQTTELKIVPVEYINSPSIRIAVYGKVNAISNIKTREGENCQVVDYKVKVPNTSNYMLKRGSKWKNDDLYKKSKNTTKVDILKEEIYQTKQMAQDDAY